MKLGACNMRRMQSLLCVEEHLLNWRNTLQYYELGPPPTTHNNTCTMRNSLSRNKIKPTSHHPSTNKPNQSSPTQSWQPRRIFAMDHASPHDKILVEIYRIRADQDCMTWCHRHSSYKWLCVVATRNVLKKWVLGLSLFDIYFKYFLPRISNAFLWSQF